MIQNLKIKRLTLNISKYFFLLLFLGFFGSVTFFNHAHVINGETIVHSHPYKPQTENSPASHNHSQNAFLLIQIISNLTLTAVILFFAVIILLRFTQLLMLCKDKNSTHNLIRYSSTRPRAPTLLLHN
jgi:hypothetical protein